MPERKPSKVFYLGKMWCQYRVIGMAQKTEEKPGNSAGISSMQEQKRRGALFAVKRGVIKVANAIDKALSFNEIIEI